MSIEIYDKERCEFNRIVEKVECDDIRKICKARKLITDNYKDIFYGTAMLKTRYESYDRVLILPYKISEGDLIEAINNKGKRSENEKADIDSNGSGNIHPSVKRIKQEYAKIGIKQIVLANMCNPSKHAGPAIVACQCMPIDEQAIYECKGLLRTPRTNYYPMITSATEEKLSKHEKEKQYFLKRIFDSFINIKEKR